MLAPDTTTTQNTLTSLVNQAMAMTAYSRTSQDTQVGKVPTEPEWLDAVRSDITKLRAAGDAWIMGSPEILGAIPAYFVNTGTTFRSVTDAILKILKEATPSTSEIVSLLGALKSSLDNNATSAQTNYTAWQGYISKFQDVQPLLEQSISDGWSALSEEESKIVEIAKALTSMQDEVASLSENMTSAMISGGKKSTTTAISTTYKLVAEGGGSFSFLSMATTGFTVGKMFYDLISDSAQIADDLSKVAQLQTEATEEAQAAAATKMVLQLLYQLEIRFAEIQDSMPALVQTFKDESAKIQVAIDGLNAGADPTAYLEIVGIEDAAQVWEELQSFAQKMSFFPEDATASVIIDATAGTISQGE